MIIMGVDFGDARTGLAICDKGEMLASPVCVVSEKDFTQCQERLPLWQRNTVQNSSWSAIRRI